jgi:hypothetical protein
MSWAVAAIEASPYGYDKVNQHILAVSTYLGHAKLVGTYVYLHTTPQLLADIASRCDRRRGRSHRDFTRHPCQHFLRERLPLEQRASERTCETYALALRLLFFEFTAQELKMRPPPHYASSTSMRLAYRHFSNTSRSFSTSKAMRSRTLDSSTFWKTMSRQRRGNARVCCQSACRRIVFYTRALFSYSNLPVTPVRWRYGSVMPARRRRRCTYEPT